MVLVVFCQCQNVTEDIYECKFTLFYSVADIMKDIINFIFFQYVLYIPIECYRFMNAEQPWRETWDDDTSIADRLANYHDIVSVHLYFKPELKTETGIEKESPELYLPWNDENCEDENDCQTNYIDRYNGFDKQYKSHKILNIHVSEINHRNREI